MQTLKKIYVLAQMQVPLTHFLDLVPLRHTLYMSLEYIGFQQPMCQFVSNFVLETKFITLSSITGIVD